MLSLLSNSCLKIQQKCANELGKVLTHSHSGLYWTLDYPCGHSHANVDIQLALGFLQLFQFMGGWTLLVLPADCIDDAPVLIGFLNECIYSALSLLQSAI